MNRTKCQAISRNLIGQNRPACQPLSDEEFRTARMGAVAAGNALGHLTLSQGSFVECARCGRSGVFGGTRSGAVFELSCVGGHRLVKTIKSHVGIARYLPDTAPIGTIARDTGIRSPYACGPDHQVFAKWIGKRTLRIFVVETAHKVYNVFEVAAGTTLNPIETEAEVVS